MVILGPVPVRVTLESRRLMVLQEAASCGLRPHSLGPWCPVRLCLCLQVMSQASVPRIRSLVLKLKEDRSKTFLEWQEKGRTQPFKHKLISEKVIWPC